MSIDIQNLPLMLLRTSTVRKLVSRVFIFFVVFSGWGNKARAYGPVGATIVYAWVSDSSYQVVYTYLSDCSSAISAPDSVALNIKNTCGFYDSVVYLHQYPTVSGIELHYACGLATTCAGGTLPGYKRYVYAATFTLYQRCDHWTFSTTEGLKDPSILNISNVSPNMYAEATLNNLDYQGNSSPVFTAFTPLVFWDSVSTFKYINAYDPNYDSLGYEMITPLSGTAANPINENYNPGYSLSHPIADNGTFKFDATLGQIRFMPYGAGKYVLSYRVSDYKRITAGGTARVVKLGSIVEQEQINVLVCPKPALRFKIDSSTIRGGTMINGLVNICAGDTLHFCYNAITTDTIVNEQIIPSFFIDDITYKIKLNHITRDSAADCFTIPIDRSDTGLKTLRFWLTDTACSNGFREDCDVLFSFKILPAAVINKPEVDFICQGDTLLLVARGDSAKNYIWNVLPGGSLLSSLSCSTCDSTLAMPNTTTSYTIYALNKTDCGNRDTITVTVRPKPAMPIVSSNSPICGGDTLRLTLVDTSATIAHQWLGPDGYASALKNPTIYPPISGIYKAYDSSNGCASYPDSVIVVVKPKPGKPIASSNSPICVHESLMLYATDTTAGVSYYWRTPDTSLFYIIPNPVIPFAAAGVYKSYVMLNGCTSDTAKLNVAVDSVGPPSVYIISNLDTAIPGFYMVFHAEVHNAGSHPRYQWLKNGFNVPGAVDSIYTTNALRAGDIMSVVVYSSVNCARPDSAVATMWPLAVQDINSRGAMDIFPNPNTGGFTVKGMVNGDVKDVKIAVLNLLGQVVYSDVATATNGNFSHEIKLTNNIPDGVYMVQVNASGNAYFSRLTLKR